MKPEVAEKVDIEIVQERLRTLPDGRRVEVRFSVGFFEVAGSTAGGEVEVWDELKLPPNVGALIRIAALEKFGPQNRPKDGKN